MKKNSFYLICGIMAVVLVILFYVFIRIRLPLLTIPAVLIAVLIFFLLKRAVSDKGMDERQLLIDMKTASATLKTGIILFLLGNIPIAVYAFSVPPMIMPMPHFHPPESIPLTNVGDIAIYELLLLAVTVVIYAGIHIYYSRKYGGDLSDEE
ncbi:MAG: DUF2178 domain-containing protein [Methanocorpusculum sp.]|nr:DUF2178 domain-containing protein [Methanocorpusculum sp.]